MKNPWLPATLSALFIAAIVGGCIISEKRIVQISERCAARDGMLLLLRSGYVCIDKTSVIPLT
jgi:hypothetical protein